MVRSCAAFNCTHRYNAKNKDISFHKFPSSKPEIEKLWILAVRRKNWTPSKSSVLCSMHFLPEDFEPFLPGSSYRKLNPTAVPSVFDFQRHLQNPTKKRRSLECHQYIGDEEKICKLKEVRTSMVDIPIPPHVLNDSERRVKVLNEIESIFHQWNLTKKYEGTFGESHIIILNNDSGSITATQKVYPFGLITVTFEHFVDEASMTEPMLQEMRKLFVDKLDARSEMIPPIKRGSTIPSYFTTADQRILEYDFDRVVFEKDSPYQSIQILHSPTFGNCLILDGKQNLAESDINYTHGIMRHGVIPYAGKDVLILGGADGGLLHELLKEKPKFVTMVYIDQMVVDACREHLRDCCGDSLDKLEGSNYKVIIDDCLKMLDVYKNEGRKFDVIINDLNDIPFSKSLQGEVWELIKSILIQSLAVLKDDGSYLNHVISEGCVDALKTYENILTNLPEKVNFDNHITFVPSFMENWVFYEVKRKL